MCRQRGIEMRATVIAVAQGNNLLPAGVDLRQHDRGLIRFGPRVREKGFLESTGCDSGEALRCDKLPLCWIERGGVTKG